MSWPTRSKNRSRAVPIEMRFVDMFMAVLGALIFMAVLLTFLVASKPNTDQTPATPSQGTRVEAGPLRLVTRTLPPALLGREYEIAPAVRGGQMPVAWKLVGSLPPGLAFDSNEGLLRGKPSASGPYRFALQVTDQAGNTETGAYELQVNEPAGQSKATKWFLYGAVILGWLVTLAIGAARLDAKSKVAIAEQRYAEGHTEVVFGQPPDMRVISLPDGIASLRAEVAGMGWSFIVMGLISVVATAFVVYWARMGG